MLIYLSSELNTDILILFFGYSTSLNEAENLTRSGYLQSNPTISRFLGHFRCTPLSGLRGSISLICTSKLLYKALEVTAKFFPLIV